MIRRGRSRTSTIPRALLEDPALSFKAIGLAAFLLSKPEGWRIDGRLLAQTHSDGRHAVYSGLKELELAGYLVRRRYQHPETGYWWTESVLYESIEAALEEASDVPPQPVDDSVGEPMTESRLSESGLPGRGKPGLTPLSEESTPPTPAERGLDGCAEPAKSNPRARGTNPRALGTNPRGRPEPKPPDPLEVTGAAGRALADRNDQRAASEAQIPADFARALEQLRTVKAAAKSSGVFDD